MNKLESRKTIAPIQPLRTVYSMCVAIFKLQKARSMDEIGHTYMSSFSCVQDEKVIVTNYIFKKSSSLTCPWRALKRTVDIKIPYKDKMGWELW
jgi:hypothetical protein